MCSCKRKPEKIQACKGFEPCPLWYWCSALTNWAAIKLTGSFSCIKSVRNIPGKDEDEMMDTWISRFKYMKFIYSFYILYTKVANSPPGKSNPSPDEDQKCAVKTSWTITKPWTNMRILYNVNTLLSSLLSCSISSACCCRVVLGVHMGLDLACSTALINRSSWLAWLLDVTPALCKARSWFIASATSCL